MGLKQAKENATKFKKGHQKVGGRRKGSPNKRIVIEIPVPLERLPTITETLAKYGVDPIKEVLVLCGEAPQRNGKKKNQLLPHQKASVLLQLEGLKKRETGVVPDPQIQTVPSDGKTMTTDELLKRVLRATHDEQLRSAPG